MLNCLHKQEFIGLPQIDQCDIGDLILKDLT